MGRSGGGGGGGHSSGGFSSGGRSSGSFSGGHSSTSFGGGGRSSSFSSHGRSSSGVKHQTNYGSSRNSLHPIIFFNNIGNNRYNESDYTNRSSNTNIKTNSKYTNLIVSIVLLAIAAVICIPMLVYSISSLSYHSDIEREPLPTSYAIGTDYYTDEDGDWVYNPSKMTKGMRDFYNNTGVWPYVYILPNGSVTDTNKLTQMAEEKYNELFEDEAHFIMVFCDDNIGGYNWGYCVGADAKTILDKEALATMNDFLERNYDNTSISEEEIFSNTFKSTSERIMGISSGDGATPYILLIVSIVLLGGCIINVTTQIISIKKKEKLLEDKEKEEKLNEILSTPLEKFTDSELDEIAEKYE